ncbi:rhamnulokinase [Lactobacillus selangorensis]|uniref:Rhamnulokinase n=1 Tax=Lactobacillus selangorensis TaxID=81857 RepID=A0A0R2FH53_9LACO|nr:rhamnulokinase [Lactobacillus selangorensis]KRN27582.1 rhamnulokinase [Lactobacillus selangorensis]KRN30145.1 rhamnulokinase [Lactobacillus selangorensis]
MHVFVAVDIGASSGRLVMAQISDQKLKTTEIHRFKNGFFREDGHDRWNIDQILKEILIGLEKVKRAGISKVTLGIDTWAVDYVLTDKDGHKLQNPISYRDARTQNAIHELTSTLPKEYLYEKTGIQFQNFNTLYQLYEEDQSELRQADKIMMIPDYLGFQLTGNAVTEVTNASTTQMLNLRKRLFDSDLMADVHVRDDQFPKLVESGTILGQLQKERFPEYELPDATVVTVASHDTASAVIGTPAEGDKWAFLSSGTWSLLGAETNVPENSLAAFHANYTNEWGAYGTYRFLKNIMGLWIIQRIKADLNDQYSFPELADMAQKTPGFRTFINVNDERFENPTNMIDEIQAYARETKQFVPQTPGELARTVYDNLALCYAAELGQLSQILKQPFETLNIVGGGSNVELLNQLTSSLANINVVAGPTEATAIGNILVQMISTGDVKNVQAARALIRTSYPLKKYVPQKSQQLEQVLAQYKQFLTQQSEQKEGIENG